MPSTIGTAVDTSTREKVCISLSHKPTAPIAYRQITYSTVASGLRVACHDSRATNNRNNQGGMDCIMSSTGSKRSEEHTSELQSQMRKSYAVFCLKKKNKQTKKKKH